MEEYTVVCNHQEGSRTQLTNITLLMLARYNFPPSYLSLFENTISIKESKRKLRFQNTNLHQKEFLSN